MSVIGVVRGGRSSGWLLASIAVGLVGEAAISSVLRVDRLMGGLADWREGLALVGLVWLMALAVLILALLSRFARVGEQLHDREEEFAIAAATSGEWLWQASPELVVTYCSPAIAEILGFQPAEIVGRSLFEFIDEADVPRARAILSAAVSSGGGWQDVELCWRRADGQPLTMHGSGLPVHDQQGRLIGFQGSRRPSADGPHRRRLAAMGERVDRVLAACEVAISLQPIVELESGRCIAVEALSRFGDGRSPDVWFAEAHTAGRGIELELCAVERALAVCGQLPAHVRMSVNASAAVIADGRFGELLAGRGELGRLTVEITEHSVVAEYEPMKRALEPLRERGLRLAVDDTGAGYASFSHVLELRPDIIKLDRSWLADIEHDWARRALCTAAVQLARGLHGRVTAEGIETPAQLAAARSLGVHHAQGYLLGRPSANPNRWSQWTDETWRIGEQGDVTLQPAFA
jgi:PAS domain S-box-containing protein